MSSARPIAFLSSAMALLITLCTQAAPIVAAGSTWRYLDSGTNLGTAWRGTNFNDNTWSNGVAQLGYGDGDESTVVSFGPDSGNKYITTYFRKRFVVADVTQVSNLVLRLLCDDGAVVYLNSNEVYRSNLPGIVTYLTPAPNALGTPEEATFVRADLGAGALVNGTNVIAVEVHQASGSSSDLSFDLELLSASLPNVLRGPWLQSVSWSNALVQWRTDSNIVGCVRFGTNAANLNFSVTGGSATTEHRLALTNLAPGRKYFYSVGLTNAALLSGPDYYVITPSLPGQRKPMRFWALGDCGTGNANQRNVRDGFYQMNASNDLDAILLLGDNAYNAGLDAEYQSAMFDMYPTVLRKTPLWSTIGNHETDQSSSPSSSIAYYQIFSLPKNGEVGGVASGTEDYYSFDYGNIHFVCLDSMTSSRSASGSMADWLRSDLGNTTQDWLIAFWHHPPYTKGSHNSDSETELIEMRQNILPILESYGVDLVLCGHSHAYERSHLLDGHYGTSGTLTSGMKKNSGGGRGDGAGAYVKPTGLSAHQGTVYVVAGSAGQVSGGSLNHPAMFLSLNQLGSLYFEVSSNRLDAAFIRETGATNDSFTIIKGNNITVADVSVIERDTDQTNAVFTLAMAQTSSVPVMVSYAAIAESALAGMDFSAAAGVVTFQPGVRTQTVLVPVIGDFIVETNETFTLNLSGTPLLARWLARGTIIDNDLNNPNLPAPKFSTMICTNSVVMLRLPTIQGRTYRVEYRDSLAAGQWAVFAAAITGNGSIYTLMDNTATNVPQRFYRVSVQ